MPNTIPEPHEHSTQIALLHRDVRSINEKVDALTNLMQASHHHDKLLHTHSLEISRLAENDKEKENRIKALESWRWYLVGLGFAIMFVVSGIPWKIAIGG